MNFTKYAAALALCATAATAATATGEAKGTPDASPAAPTVVEAKPTVDALKNAMDKCGTVATVEKYVECMKTNGIKQKHIAEAAFAKKDQTDLKEDNFTAIIETADPSEAYSTTFWALIAVGSVIVVGAIGGGIYMATRSSETDL